MPSKNQTDLHIFDCDGVILDSNDLKVAALRSSLESIAFPDRLVAWMTAEFRANFGRTRAMHFEVFRNHAQLQGFHVDQKEMDIAMQRYSESVRFLYSDCTIIGETKSYIDELPTESLVFVVSASDQSELRELLPEKYPILKRDHIFGGPIPKLQNISNVLGLTKASEAFFYGDSILDAKAALDAGIRFVGLKKYSADQKSLEDFCMSNNLDCVEDCSEVVLYE